MIIANLLMELSGWSSPPHVLYLPRQSSAYFFFIFPHKLPITSFNLLQRKPFNISNLLQVSVEGLSSFLHPPELAPIYNILGTPFLISWSFYRCPFLLLVHSLLDVITINTHDIARSIPTSMSGEEQESKKHRANIASLGHSTPG